jgi:hypothetical protein
VKSSIGEGGDTHFAQAGVAMKLVVSFALMAAAAGVTLASAEPVHAQTAAPQVQRAASQTSSDFSAQRRLRRRATPIYIYGRRPLSPTAVRACVDWYEYEYRPSGTVIVPRMSCHWIDR